MVLAESANALTIPGVFGVLGAFFGIIALVAAAVAVFRANYMKATIDTLKESNAALSDRNDQLDRDIAECQKQLATLKAENHALQNYVSGTEAIHELGHQLKEQHTEAMVRWAEVAETVNSVVLLTEHERAKPTRRAPAKKTANGRRAQR